MPRKIKPKPCLCGCGDMTKGGKFLPGHDAKLYGAIVEAVGGVENLRTIIEKKLRQKIVIEY